MYVSSTCLGPHRSIIRSIFYKLNVQIWYVVIRVLPNMSSHYEVVGSRKYTYYHIPNLLIQLVKNAPEDGLVRSETCRAKHMWWINSIIKKLCVSCWTAYILQDDTWFLQYQVNVMYLLWLFEICACICLCQFWGTCGINIQYNSFQQVPS